MSNPNEPSTPATELTAPFPAVLFADISGSTMLYEKLGDAAAKTLVDECLEIMRSVTVRRGGRVIKTIGDELMCVFPDADRASLAATDMQLAVSSLPPTSGVSRAIRIGLHAGPLIQERDDVFGDTVNTAARMASLAKASQVITTAATVMLMSPLLRSGTRQIAALAVRGKGDDIEVCEVLWQASDELTMAASVASRPAILQRLRLTHAAHELTLEAAGGFVVLGRDPSCHIVLAGRKASRLHARIEWRRDKFFLIDQSTNGTYVSFVDEAEVVLRREEAMLRGRGFICFGHSIADSNEETVEFVMQ
ncbi:MAG: adenylate/guanylate cyclase domain-containing protein [Burkholderiales bacterium]|nr:adenylate/guanylate cyclase domain-containing protein [Burkholderiales bacterium]